MSTKIRSGSAFKVRSAGIAFDMEEYVEGLIAVGIPRNTYSEHTQTVIWAVRVNHQLEEEKLV